MIRIQQVSKVSYALQQSIFGLVQRCMQLQQQLKVSKVSTVSKQFFESKIKQFELVILNKTNTISKLEQELRLKNGEIDQLNTNIKELETKQIQKKKQITQLQITSVQNLHQLQVENNNLKAQVLALQEKLEEKQQMINQSIMELSEVRSRQSLVEIQSDELKQVELCEQCRSKVYMIFYNKEKKNRELKRQNQRLNTYIGQITEDPKFQKSINNQLTHSMIEECFYMYEKDMAKQSHYIRHCAPELKDKVINNMNSLLKNFRRQLFDIIRQSKK